MDLNYLLSRHQISLIRADTTLCPQARMAHRGMARGYADRVRIFQNLIGAQGTALLQA